MRHIRLILPAMAAFALSPVASPSFAQSTACGPGTPVEQSSLSQVPSTVPPPALPEYEQPPIPAPGYIWTPGYWASGSSGYYWIPGTWVEPPSPGLLWTPGYWGWFNGAYIFSAGYWGPHVGFYGGINYGYGYGGVGYEGGYWDHGAFNYNRTVNNFGGVHITNVYNKTIINNTTTRVSFNGGEGGTNTRPTQAEVAVLRENRVAPTPNQVHHFEAARADPSLRASENHGNPPIAATARPGEFKEGVVPAGAHPANAETHPGPGAEGHPAAANETHPPAGEAHPGAANENHPPAGEAHPPTQPVGRPPNGAEGHPAAVAPEHEAPVTHAPEAHPGPAPAPRPEARPAPAPHPEARPAPAPHAAPAHPAQRPEEKR